MQLLYSERGNEEQLGAQYDSFLRLTVLSWQGARLFLELNEVDRFKEQPPVLPIPWGWLTCEEQFCGFGRRAVHRALPRGAQWRVQRSVWNKVLLQNSKKKSEDWVHLQEDWLSHALLRVLFFREAMHRWVQLLQLLEHSQKSVKHCGGQEPAQRKISAKRGQEDLQLQKVKMSEEVLLVLQCRCDL